MEFDRQGDGTLKPLPALSVDTGMGLERVTSVIQGKLATYDTDLFAPILDAIGRAAGRRYTAAPGPADHPDVSMRVIADHVRAMTFLIGDGVLPSNEWRGYVLRKIMRRAMRHGKKLGYTKPVLNTFVDVVVDEMGDAYPELVTGRDAIRRTVKAEEERFDAVLTSGLPKLEELIDRTIKAGRLVLDGDEVFRLYDSLGVPLDFAEDLAAQRGLSIDRQAYEASMEGQRERARAGSKFGGDAAAGAKSAAAARVDRQGDDQFVGYDRTTETATVVGVHELNEPGADALVWLDRTPFYVESGGQVSDTGELVGEGGARATVTGVRKAPAGHMRAHVVTFASGRPPRWMKRAAMRPAGITRPRTCCTRHCGSGWARTCIRKDRWSRPIACGSTSRTTRGSAPTSAATSNASSTNRSTGMRRSRPKSRTRTRR
jgi:alanyl-tRNA synthetase